MLKEVLDYLKLRTGDTAIDGTLGGGAYTLAMAQAVGKQGRVLAIDLDPLAIKHAEEILQTSELNNVVLALGNFKNLQAIAQEKLGPEEVAAIVLDLGLSSAQLSDLRRGFSFRAEAPLAMSFGAADKENRTATIVNTWRAEELADVIKRYGEERYAKTIAKSIVAARQSAPISTTGQLLAAIERAVPAVYRRGRLHWATRTFQALRIATNDELANLEAVLPQALALLKPGGRLAVVSFHSLEDRIVKQFFRREATACLCPPTFPACVCGHRARLRLVTGKALRPGVEEVTANHRARSAKLRVAEKLID